MNLEGLLPLSSSDFPARVLVTDKGDGIGKIIQQSSSSECPSDGFLEVSLRLKFSESDGTTTVFDTLVPLRLETDPNQPITSVPPSEITYFGKNNPNEELISIILSDAKMTRMAQGDKYSEDDIDLLSHALLKRVSAGDIDGSTRGALLRLRDYYKIRGSRGNVKLAREVMLASLPLSKT